MFISFRYDRSGTLARMPPLQMQMLPKTVSSYFFCYSVQFELIDFDISLHFDNLINSPHRAISEKLIILRHKQGFNTLVINSDFLNFLYLS